MFPLAALHVKGNWWICISFTIPYLFLLTLHNSYSGSAMSKNESPTRISRFLPGSTPTLTGMLCRGYLPPGKHSRTPTSRRHESGHNSFLLERFNSVLLSSQILYSFFFNSCQTRRRSALRYSLHAPGFAKTSKKAVAPQKRDFPIS